MKKIFKKIVASIMAATTLAVGMAGMSASAAPFAINLGRGGFGSVTEIKENTHSYASISSENLSNTACVSFCLKNSSGSSISATQTRTGNGSFTLNYTTTPPIGTPVTLVVNAGYYGVNASISGEFTP